MIWGKSIFVCGKTDLRKGIDGLATLVKEQFELDPFSGRVFLFCGGSKDRFKALYWDGQGFWLLYKALWQVIGTNAAKRPAKPV